jgi:putative peptidoglycan lipid II flippase
LSKSLAKSTTVVGGMTLASRVMGFLRDMVFARFFGAGAGMDVFVVAFQIPNFLRRLFGEGAFSQAFVPVLSEYRSQREEEDVRALADRVAGTLGVILFFISAAGILIAPALILLFAPGFAQEPDKYELATTMLRITFPYLLFICLVAFAGGILNTYGRFAVPAFTPVLLNLTLIAAAVLLAPRLERPIVGLAIGVFVAGIVQLLFQLPWLRRLGLLPRPRWGWSHEGVRRISRLMLPALFGSSVAQINLIVDRVIASSSPPAASAGSTTPTACSSFPWASSPSRWPRSSSRDSPAITPSARRRSSPPPSTGRCGSRPRSRSRRRSGCWCWPGR